MPAAYSRSESCDVLVPVCSLNCSTECKEVREVQSCRVVAIWLRRYHFTRTPWSPVCVQLPTPAASQPPASLHIFTPSLLSSPQQITSHLFLFCAGITTCYVPHFTIIAELLVLFFFSVQLTVQRSMFSM